jgi:pyrroline-5-carboxylate reductase
MVNTKIGFIGAGNMGGALAKAVCQSAEPKNVYLADKSGERAFELAKKLSCSFSNNNSIAFSCNFIFLGVKPQMMEDMLREIAPVLKERKEDFTLISMAAGVKIERITQMLGFECPVIRIMPNTAVEVGEGMVLYTVNEKVTEDVENAFLSFMSKAGELDKISENLINKGHCRGCTQIKGLVI